MKTSVSNIALPLVAGLVMAAALTNHTLAQTAPTITIQPHDLTVDAGANATFVVSAEGTPPLSYQWLFNGSHLTDNPYTYHTIEGSQSPSLSLIQVWTNVAGDYSVLVHNSFGSVTSTVARLLVGPTPETIFNNVNSGGVSHGPTIPTEFAVSSPCLITVIDDYHWQSTALPGTIALRHSDGTVYGPWQTVEGLRTYGVTNSWWKATPHTLIKAGNYTVIDSDNPSWSYNNGGGFSVVYGFTNLAAFVPVITAQPQSQIGFWGRTARISVTAIGDAPLNYQWQKNGLPVADGTNSALVLSSLQLTDAGAYTVVVTNPYGSVTSAPPAILTVNPSGVAIALYAGVTIDGVTNQTYGIQSTLDLSNTNSWAGRANVTLTNATQLWYDSQPATQPQTYYRVLPGPISIP